MVKSHYQVEIDRVFIETKLNILINAVAGSGKTTTLLSLFEHARGEIMFLAFNKSIVTELQERTGYDKDSLRVNISTFHSLGMRSLMQFYNKQFKVDPNKTWGILEILNKKWKVPKKTFPAMAFTLCQLYDIYRLTLCRDLEDLKVSAGEIGINWEESHMVKMKQVLAMMKAYNTDPEKIDFTDMVYLVAVNDVNLPTPDVLFVDEAQDMNACQHHMINRMKIKGRLIAAGDRQQAIYGFAGADTASFDRFKNYPNTIELPLSVCYRCGTRIVDQARKINTEIEAFPGNKPGIVKMGNAEEIAPGDMVLCRNVKPLIKLFFKIIDRGLKAQIKGEDLGKGLVQLISPHTGVSLEELRTVLKDKLERRCDELIEKGIEDPKKHPSYRNLFEKVEIVFFLSTKFTSVREVVKFFEKVFSDRVQENSVSLSTIHKAKGLENDRVFLLDKFLMPSEFAKTEEQLTQESNLLYVALTRAKSSLIFIKSMGSKISFEKQETIKNGGNHRNGFFF